MLGVGARDGEQKRKDEVGELHCGWLICLMMVYSVVIVICPVDDGDVWSIMLMPRLASVDSGVKSVVAELSSQLASRSKRKE